MNVVREMFGHVRRFVSRLFRRGARRVAEAIETHMGILYDPEPGVVFAFARHDPHDIFIRDPRTNTIMRLSTYQRRYGGGQ